MCEITFHHTPSYLTISDCMRTNSNKAQRTSTQKNRRVAPVKHVRQNLRTTEAKLAEPDDGMSSEVESFDEGDMYPANYNDEAVPCSDSDTGSNGDALSRLVRHCLVLYDTFNLQMSYM